MNRGIDWTLNRLKRIIAGAHEIGVGVGTIDTVGLPSPIVYPEMYGRKPQKSSRRSASENATLINIHKKGGLTGTTRKLPSRNPFFLTESEYNHINDMWINIINELTLGKIKIKIEEKARDIGTYVADRWREHIEKRIGEKGKIEDVMPGTEKQKERDTGRRGLPPLYRTGMLYRSFDYKVKRYR